MASRMRSKLTYSNVVSTLCLFLLLGGGAYAAIKLPKNSVGTKQIKINAVTTSKIKNAAVTGEKLAAGSVGGAQLQANSITSANVKGETLTASDLAPGTIPTPTPRTAQLQSGETITGFMAIESYAPGGSDFFGTAGSFAFLPQNPIPASNRIMVSGSSGPHCPGIGQADPGYLCAYGTVEENAKEPRLYPETGLQTNPATYGIELQVASVTEGTVLYYAVWAYTEP